PATIISRTQRYNFKRISNDQLVARMKFILDQEKIAYDEKSLQVIAQVADGGMRDSLSILDQILSYDQAKINYQDTLAITGYADQVKIEALFLDLLNKKTSQALEEVEELLNNGASAKNILDEIINLVVKAMLAIKGDTTVTFLSANYLEQLRLISTQVLSQTLQLAN
ncbi:MAG: DNA polymerase III subunit gamma/tau, partial [Lactobacillus iners]|nr:DNA polymerase III subunit gamma/tau [Lactobacillus iners]